MNETRGVSPSDAMSALCTRVVCHIDGDVEADEIDTSSGTCACAAHANEKGGPQGMVAHERTGKEETSEYYERGA